MIIERVKKGAVEAKPIRMAPTMSSKIEAVMIVRAVALGDSLRRWVRRWVLTGSKTKNNVMVMSACTEGMNDACEHVRSVEETCPASASTCLRVSPPKADDGVLQETKPVYSLDPNRYKEQCQTEGNGVDDANSFHSFPNLSSKC